MNYIAPLSGISASLDDDEFARALTRQLDEVKLPPNVATRLARSRTIALNSRRAGTFRQFRHNFGFVLSLDRRAGTWIWPAFATLLVAAFLTIGSSAPKPEVPSEHVDIDIEILTDTLPLAAYTDENFGHYLQKAVFTPAQAEQN